MRVEDDGEGQEATRGVMTRMMALNVRVRTADASKHHHTTQLCLLLTVKEEEKKKKGEKKSRTRIAIVNHESITNVKRELVMASPTSFARDIHEFFGS